jgi:hypothetical protein
MKKIAFSTIALLVLGMLVSGTAFAQAAKVNVCHVTGNGGFQMLSISTRALEAHIGHGDFMPGEIISEGTPYAGLYGSWVTLITLIGDDCSVSSVLRIDSTQNFGSGGWAGWSCIQPGYLKVVGGGVVPETAGVIAQGAAKYGAAAIDGNNYPVYPHYTYNLGVNAPGGEEGWVVRAGSPVPTGIYVLCGQ